MLLNNNCPWCGLLLNKHWNREHIIPRSTGAGNKYNIMRAHEMCNRARGSKLDMIGVNPDNNMLVIPDMYKRMDEDMLYYTIRAMYTYSPILLRDLRNKTKSLENNIKILEEYSSGDYMSQISLTTYKRMYYEANDEYTKLNNLVNAIEAGTIDIKRNFNET